jgi:hypothetical protein
LTAAKISCKKNELPKARMGIKKNIKNIALHTVEERKQGYLKPN